MIQNTYGDQSPGRVLLVITTLTFGGAETQLAHLAMGLKERGWTVAVACLVDPNAHSARLEHHGIAVHSLGMRRGLPDPRALLRLRSLVRRFRPDIVHSHMFHANLLARLCRLICQFPALVSTVHNVRETSERGGPTWHKELLYRATDFLADKTTIICRAAYRRHLSVRAVPAKKLQVIPNGVDTNTFCPSAEAKSAARASLGVQSRFVWLAVGRLVKQKDFHTLFRAIEQLKRSDSLLLVAGSGPLESELRQESARLRIADRVRFCGVSENILRLYRCADAFVLSSEFEGLSSALLEAASMALPAVVTDVGGNAEIVLEGVTGHLVPPHDPARLADAMRRLEQTPVEQRHLLGAAARQHCWTNYRMEAVTRQWTDLYQTYLRRKPAYSLANGASASEVRA
jgi:glycosyltransferase involved in cell wall biosynthesis